MENPMHYPVQDGKRVMIPKRRRPYKVRSTQGRRTKLTGELLQAISEIVAVMEIISISHLNRELVARGYSLSRSTVFRAMEALGLKVDRDRKIWCAGPLVGDRVVSASLGPTTQGQREDRLGQEPDEIEDAAWYCDQTQDDLARLDNLGAIWQVEGSQLTSHLYRRHSTGSDLMRGALDARRQSSPPGSLQTSTDDLWETSLIGTASRQSLGVRNGQHVQLEQDTPTKRPPQVITQANDKAARDMTLSTLASMNSYTVHSPRPTITWVGSPRELAQASGIISVASYGNSGRSRKRKSDRPSRLAAFEGDAKVIHIQTNAASQAKSGQSLFKGQEEDLETHSTVISTQAKIHPGVIISPSNKPRGELSVASWQDGREAPERRQQPTAGRGEQRPGITNGMDGRQVGFQTLDETPRRGMAEAMHSENTPRTASILDRHKVRLSGIPREAVSPQDHRELLAVIKRKREDDSQLTQPFPDATKGDARPRQDLERGWLSLHSSDAQTAETGTGPRPSVRDIVEAKMHEGPDPQRARLHALTSTLAAKTLASVNGVGEVASKGREARAKEDANHVETLASPSDSARSHFPQQSRRPQTDAARSHDVETKMTTPRRQDVALKFSKAQRRSNGAQRTPLSLGEFPLASHDASDEDDKTPHPSSGFSQSQMQELRHWMQDVSQKLNSMDRQIQCLSDFILSITGQEFEGKDNRQQTTPVEPSVSLDPEDLEGRECSEGDLKEGEGYDEGGAAMEVWGTRLPPVNTPQSNELISKLLEDGPWDSLSPFVGGPRLAIRLARDCIFGPEVLSRSTVTGRNGMYPLQREGIKKIKDCLLEQYGHKCTEGELEMLWKMTRESLSQLCKRIRRQLAAEDNEQETDSQDDSHET